MIKIQDLGLTHYSDALKIMEETHQQVVQDPTCGVILLTQHYPTVTIGLRDIEKDLSVLPAFLHHNRIAYFKTDRGGQATVHEPGQAVIYPIIPLDGRRLTVKTYVCLLEDAMKHLCQEWGVPAHTDSKYPGVWIGQDKIGALGIRVLNKVSKHGIAFNISNTLETFQYITPCGIRDRGVTTLKHHTPHPFLYLQVAMNLALSIQQRLYEILNRL
jgi:lipoate-protein ligase B